MLSRTEFIAFLLESGALRFGDFTLKSGARSPFFVNLGEVRLGAHLATLGSALADALKESFPDVNVLFGPPYKGISLVTAAAIAWHQRFATEIATTYRRKEVKGHGEGGNFVGHRPRSNDRVVIVDDVMSDGQTKFQAIDRLQAAFGVKAPGILVCVDRRPKTWSSKRKDLKVASLATLSDLIDYLRAKDHPQHQAMIDFYEGRI